MQPRTKHKTKDSKKKFTEKRQSLYSQVLSQSIKEIRDTSTLLLFSIKGQKIVVNNSKF